MDQVTYSPIGIIRSPFKEPKGAPIQPISAIGIKGSVEIHEEFLGGLKDLEGFSHIFLIYHFHLSKGYSLEVEPFLDKDSHGLFATRAPKRPNPIGISVVRLVGIKGAVLEIEDVDVVDGTPLLDIKPYIPELDCRPADRIGWFTGKVQAARGSRADERFK